MGEQYIFTIESLSKAYGKREVLKNIWLAFYPGAKIGVIGSNGAGKSTLLRVMALQEKDFIGTGRLMPMFEGVGTERLTRTVAARRIGTPEDCATVVGFLAGPESDYVTGTVIPIDGGSTT